MKDNYRINNNLINKELQLPSKNDEDWKYCYKNINDNINNFDNENIVSDGLDIDVIDNEIYDDYHKIVFINGVFQQKYSSPLKDYVDIYSITDNKDKFFYENKNDILSDFNYNKFKDGYYLDIKQDSKIAVFYISSQDVAIRNKILVSNNSNVNIIEVHKSINDDNYIISNYNDYYIDDTSNLNLYVLQLQNFYSSNLSSYNVKLGNYSNFENFHYINGSIFNRNNLTVTFNGKGNNANSNCYFNAREKQKIDNNVNMNHISSHNNSNQKYYCTINDNAIGSFMGTVFVPKDSIQNDAHQTHKAILLSDNAVSNSRPLLKILNDDIQCSHGSATGGLDDNQLLYMMSRGINKDRAIKLILSGLALDLFSDIDDDNIRKLFSGIIEKENA